MIADRVVFMTSQVASAGVNPAGKLTSIIAGMIVGADCIEDLDLLRCGGMSRLFTDVYAPATLGSPGNRFLRKGLSPLATTLFTATGAPVIAGIRLRAGRAGSGKGAASMVTRCHHPGPGRGRCR